MAKFQTLTENWSTNSNTIGNVWSGYFGTTAITGNQCQYTINTGASNFAGFTSTNSYNLTDSFCFMQLVNGGNQALVSLEVYLAQLQTDANNKLTWYLNQNILKCFKTVATIRSQVGSNLAYDATLHKYFRIRELNGSIYWDYSTDGINWINQTSTPTPIAITAMTLGLSVGTTGTEASGTTVTTGNVSIVDTNRPGNLPSHFSVSDGMSRSEIAN